ncbi:Methyltransferase-like protein 2-A [Mactra antiquata]
MAESEEICSGTDKRKQFGNRLLTDPQNVFEHNAWDNVVWDETQELEAKMKTDEQLKHLAAEQDREKYEKEANMFWDSFYGKHENKFFKDRHWLFTEFTELAPESYLSKDKLEKLSDNVATDSTRELNDIQNDSTDYSGDKSQVVDDNVDASKVESMESKSSTSMDMVGESMNKADGNDSVENYPGESAKYRLLEVGCGVGNTVFPILQANNDPDLMLYCCDYSSTAIQLVKENVDYNTKRCHAFVCDISDPSNTIPFPDESLDIIILIFILSANHPDKFQYILNRLAGFLKPGGMILFRDYGRYDLAQLRFKKGKCLGENFYVRGDGTRVYFFTQEELRDMMTKAGLIEQQNLVDRRLQVNRGKQLKMYRVWIQCKYQKPLNKSEHKTQEESDR